MIRVSARGAQLVQRLRARAERIADQHAATGRLRSAQRSNWRSAAALWPDLFGDPRDGK
jgi:hypothetical protein